MERRRTSRGVTLIELLASLTVAGVLLALTSAALCGDGHGARTKSRTERDAEQLRLIHQTFVIWARESGEGSFPRPGLVDRKPVDMGGRMTEVPGRGDEDTTRNTTASLYAAMIVQNYFTSKLIVSPVERNPHVTIDDDYHYDRYDPTEDVYWDPSFTADLATGSNASYAHLPMHGKRMRHQWRDSLDAAYTVLGNRGPLGGEPDADSHTCGPHGNWAGNIVFNDNHTEFLASMTTEHIKRRVDDESKPDNLFAMEEGPEGADVVLAFTSEMTEEGPKLQYD